VTRRLHATGKRGFDLLAASVGLVLVSPVLLVVAVMIHFDSSGGIIFGQQRIGRGFRPFKLLKFRTMVHNAAQIGPAITAGDDPRITRIGRFLRKSKIDEVPQLLNVIRGEMSLVGPRPEVPKYVEMFRDDYREILKVRPGITDGASIRYRDEASLLVAAVDPEEEYRTYILPTKLALAKEYVRRNSILSDTILITSTLLHLTGVVRDDSRRVSTKPGESAMRKTIGSQ